MEELRPNEQRAKYAIILIWIVMAIEIISFISEYFQLMLLKTIARGGIVPPETLTANDTREQLIAIIYLIVFIISAGMFIRWFRRAYFNLHQRVTHLSETDGWVAASWFVPILSLFKPYQLMKELYQETKILLTKKGIDVNEQLLTNALGLWWTLWIVNNLIGQFVFRYAMNADTIDKLMTSTIASMISDIIGIPLAIITVKVIRDYSEVEPLLRELSDEETITGNSGMADAEITAPNSR